MKKILALLVALMMALGCCSAVAEEETGAAFALPAITETSELHVNQEAFLNLLPMLGVTEDMVPIFQTILPLLDNLTEKTVIEGNGFQLDLGLKGNNVITLAGEVTEKGIVIASDVIPSYEITLSMDTIKNIMDQMMGQVQEATANVDMGKLVENLTGYFMQYIGVCANAGTMGEPEMGEYTFEGIDYTFNSKTPVTIDTEAIKAAAETLIGQLKADETIASLIAQMQQSGVQVNMDENVNIVMPEIECNAYANVDENGVSVDNVSYVVVDTATTVEEKTVNVNVTVLVEGNQVTVNVDIPEQDVQVVVLVQPNESGVYVTCDLYANGMYAGADVTVTLGEKLVIDSALYFMDQENPLLTETVTLAFEGERTFTLGDEAKTVITVEDIMADQEGTVAQTLLMDVMTNGLNGLMARAAETMPDEVTNLMTLLMGGALDGAEAPAAE